MAFYVIYKKESYFFYKEKSFQLGLACNKKLKLFLLMNVSNFLWIFILAKKFCMYICGSFSFFGYPLTQAFRTMIIFQPNNLQLHIFFSYLICSFILRLVFTLQMLKEKKSLESFGDFSHVADF